MSAENRVFAFADCKVKREPWHVKPASVDPETTAVVIDAGSHNVRLGWSSEPDAPRIRGFKPVMARTRKDGELLVADDLLAVDSFRGFNLKTPFDRNVVTQFEAMETILDYGFAHLGLNHAESEEEKSRVQHKVVMTEPVANPTFCRALMNELLFECYGVPAAAYGVDGLFSLYQNIQGSELDASVNALIVSIGFHTVHFIPVIEGKVCSQGLKRLNLGGFNMVSFLQRVLQLKYPAHVNNITVPRAEEMLFDHCKIVAEYEDELRKWTDRDFYAGNVKKMQLPFTPGASGSSSTPLDPEALRLKRQELAKRLVEINTRKRAAKLAQDEALLKSLPSCRRLLEQGYEDKVRRMLAKHDVDVDKKLDSGELERFVEETGEKARLRIEKTRSAMNRKKEEPVEEEVPKKKHRNEMTEAERIEHDSWIEDLKKKRSFFLERRAARHNRRQQLAKRRTAASQERMRVISQLAKNTKKEDDFGRNDDDWDVYKIIRKDQGESDSEEEQVRLAELDTLLKENDPEFRLPEDDEIRHDSPEWYQLHLATETIRTPEILFQPSIIGSDQAGISECIDFILQKYDAKVQAELVQNIFLTGAAARIPGLKSRVERDLLRCRPCGTDFRVRLADDPNLDAWKGAAKFAAEAEDDKYISKSEYEEKGSGYLAEHACSNFYTPMNESE